MLCSALGNTRTMDTTTEADNSTHHFRQASAKTPNEEFFLPLFGRKESQTFSFVPLRADKMSPAVSSNSEQFSRPDGQSSDKITHSDTANDRRLDTSLGNRGNAGASFNQSSETTKVANRMSENSERIENNMQESDQVKWTKAMPKSHREGKLKEFLTIKMELKFTILPKSSKRDCSLARRPTKLALAILMLAVSVLNCTSGHQIHEPNSVNEISQQPQTNFSHLTRDVTNLRMTSDWRSIKLRWNYVQPSASQIAPAAFEIRYCELTSWLAEIKCRHRDVPVVNECNSTANSTVIVADCGRRLPETAGVVHQLASGELVESGTGQKSIPLISTPFESHIFDLRALTNYTFGVRVARFSGEPTTPVVVGSSKLPVDSMARTRPRPARRLEFASNNENKLVQRVETKPFQAEALKCLANSSEVLINTGRYFGGRISVEGQPLDPRCQLIGNRTSDQTSYLFRINHELCRSKKIDSNRIETMILVHENKDILTHNTARFLVQCNIMQKSFTVKASVSLPKINGLNQQQPAVSFRPATITALASKPARELRQDEQQVRLGSMPGVYRLIRAGASADQEDGTRSGQLADIDAAAAVAQLGNRQQVASRRSKELLAHEVTTRDNGSKSGNYQFELPKPVEVSSKILFVARTNNGLELPVAAASESVEPVTRHRSARLDSIALKESETAPQSSLSSDDETRNVLARFPAPATEHHGELISTGKSSTMQMGADREHSLRTTSDDEGDSSMKSAVIMINNHRVAGHFPALAELTTASLKQPVVKTVQAGELTSATNNAGDYSIKYSPADVSEYSLDSTLATTTTHKSADSQQHIAPTGPMIMATSSALTRSRSGRMRHIVSSPAPSGANLMVGQSHKAEGRMGDIPPPLDLMGAESAVHKEASPILPPDGAPTQVNGTSFTTGQSPSPPTLAQNITGALIRWSLKTLGNLARKSLESLEERDLFLHDDNQTTASSNGELTNLRDGFLVDGGQLVKSSVPTRQDWPIGTTSAATTTGGGLQQPAKAATQSADLIQSRGQHHLLPPPPPTSLAPKQNLATTRALTTTTPSNSPQTTSSGLLQSTTYAPAVMPQQHMRKSQSFSGLQQHKNHDEPLKDHQQPSRAKSALKSVNSIPENESQMKQVTGSLSPLWPVYAFWALIGLGVLCMIIVYFLAFAPANNLKPPASRHAQALSSATTASTSSQQPRMGFLSQLNDAIYRHQLATPQTFNTPEMGSPQPGASNVNTISRLLPHADVRSPRQQRRHLNDLPHRTNGNLRQTTQPGQASSSANSSVLDSGAATRSTSAASTANMSTMRTEENYCKNHEQFVYTDYLLLSNSDCLANDCSRESFA